MQKRHREQLKTSYTLSTQSLGYGPLPMLGVKGREFTIHNGPNTLGFARDGRQGIVGSTEPEG